MVCGRRAIDPQVVFAAKFDCRVAHVDADALPPAGAQVP